MLNQCKCCLRVPGQPKSCLYEKAGPSTIRELLLRYAYVPQKHVVTQSADSKPWSNYITEYKRNSRKSRRQATGINLKAHGQVRFELLLKFCCT